MFGTDSVFCIVRDLRVKTFKKEQNTSQQVEVTMETPLTRDLADSILPAMARDLYRKVKDEYVATPELGEVSFLLPLDPMIVDLRNHPDLPVEAKLEAVQIKQIWAKKADSGSWDLSFVMFFGFGDPAPIIMLIQRLKQGAYVTCTVMEPKLPMDGDAARTAPADDDVVDAEVQSEGESQAEMGLVPTDGSAPEPRKRSRRKALGPKPDAVEQPTAQNPEP
jgi:hypothetical protein